MLELKLKALRTSKKLTKKEVAKILGIHESTYGKYELGQRVPDLKMAAALAAYYGVTVDFLLGGPVGGNLPPLPEIIENIGIKDAKHRESLQDIIEMMLTNERIKELSFVESAYSAK